MLRCSYVTVQLAEQAPPYLRLSLSTTGVNHGPCLRAVNTAVQHGCHFGYPRLRAVFTAPVYITS